MTSHSNERPLVACDDELRYLEPALHAAGFAVTPLHRAPLNRVHAVLLSGMDDNLLGDLRRRTGAAVLSAAGLTPQEVVERLQTTLGHGPEPMQG